MLPGLVACGGAKTEETDADVVASNDPAVTLVCAEVNPLDTDVGMTASKFKEEVENLSGGIITIGNEEGEKQSASPA